MATSAFKSTTKRASIGGSSSEDSAPRSLRRSRSLSRFSRPIAAEPEVETVYNKDVPRGKFVNTTRGSGVPFPEISLDDLALEFFSSSSKNESDGGLVERNEREGRSASRRGEIGRWASDTASSRRRGRSVSRGRGDAVSTSSAASEAKKAVPSDAGSRRRRSVSVARSNGNAVSGGDKVVVSSDAGTRRRRSLSVARPRYQISDSESDVDRSLNSSYRATVKAHVGGNTQLPVSSKAAAPSGRSRRHIDLSLTQDGYSSQSSALTDDESKDTHFGKNGYEKIIRAVHAQKKAEHPSEDVANGGLYDAMRKELRHAVEEIRTELNQKMGRSPTSLGSDDCLHSENSKSLQDSYRIREKYAQKLEQLEKRKKNLLTEMLLEEQCGQEASQAYEELPHSRAPAPAENPPRARKRSSDRSRMSDILIEDAERYFVDFISNIEDTDLSSFDGERSDGSSTLGGIAKGRRDFAMTDADTCRTPAGPTSRPVEMDGVILPWLQWETSHDGSPIGKTMEHSPATQEALQRDSNKDTIPLHDPSSYSMSSHGSWSPGLFHGSPMEKREEVCPTKTSSDMEEYIKLENSDEILFEMYRERNRIGLGGLLLCAGVFH